MPVFELICNALLWLGLLYVWCFNVLEAPIPAKILRNPYALKPDAWPRGIIVLLLICIAANIVKIIRANWGRQGPALEAFAIQAKAFLASRVFFGIVIIVGASFLIEPLGYMATCFLVLVLYGLLLGERNVLRLLLISALVTVGLYGAFSVLLSVNLPRGTIPEMRSFALYVERLVSQAKAAMF